MAIAPRLLESPRRALRAHAALPRIRRAGRRTGLAVRARRKTTAREFPLIHLPFLLTHRSRCFVRCNSDYELIVPIPSPSCRQFVLIVGSTIFLIVVIIGSVQILYSIGTAELPSVLTSTSTAHLKKD